VRRTSTPPTPAGRSPRTPTPSGCAPWSPTTSRPAATARPRRSSPSAPASPSASPRSPRSPTTSLAGCPTSTTNAPWAPPTSPPATSSRCRATARASPRAPSTAKSDSTHPGVKKIAEIVAVTTFTPAARTTEDIAAPAARRAEHPGPTARDTWVSASITDDIPAVIGRAFDEADWRDPHPDHQRIFLVDGNHQQITAIGEHAKKRGLKVPIIIDYIHVAEYARKAAVQLNRGKTATEISQWGDGQLPRITHGRAKAVAATLASLAAKRRTHPRTRDQDFSDVDRAVTYLTNNHQHMRYDQALANGWPIATGLIEGACRHVIEDRFGITGARWSPDGAEDILKLRGTRGLPWAARVPRSG